MKRTIAIGDIHGGLRALTQLLEIANVTENDQLIFIGDLVDGWSESYELIDFLSEWLVNHIRQEDKKIGKAIAAQG